MTGSQSVANFKDRAEMLGLDLDSNTAECLHNFVEGVKDTRNEEEMVKIKESDPLYKWSNKTAESLRGIIEGLAESLLDLSDKNNVAKRMRVLEQDYIDLINENKRLKNELGIINSELSEIRKAIIILKDGNIPTNIVQSLGGKAVSVRLRDGKRGRRVSPGGPGPGTQAGRILACLKKFGTELTAKNISVHVGLAPGKVSAHLYQMNHKGLVEKMGRGIWRAS